MKKLATISSLFFFLLTGCTETTTPAIDIDPTTVSVTVTPNTIKVNEPVTITVQETGMSKDFPLKVDVDVRSIKDKSTTAVLLTKKEGDGYTATHTFKEKGKISLNVHLYQEDLHVIKQATVDVL